jgi:hypothetical protein
MKVFADAVYLTISSFPGFEFCRKIKDKSVLTRRTGSAEVGPRMGIHVSAPAKTRGTAHFATFTLENTKTTVSGRRLDVLQVILQFSAPSLQPGRS